MTAAERKILLRVALTSEEAEAKGKILANKLEEITHLEIKAKAIYTLVRDTREQKGWTAPPGTPIVDEALEAGDYSIKGCEHLVSIERKSLEDLIGTLFGFDAQGGSRWARFTRELDKLRTRRFRAVVVEANISSVRNREWRVDAGHPICRDSRAWWDVLEKLKPDDVARRVRQIHAEHGVPVLWLGTREQAGREAFGLLRAWWEAERSRIPAPGSRREGAPL